MGTVPAVTSELVKFAIYINSSRVLFHIYPNDKLRHFAQFCNVDVHA